MLSFLGKVVLHAASLIPVFAAYSGCALQKGEIGECLGYLIVCGLLWLLSTTAINQCAKVCERMRFKYKDIEPIEDFSIIWGLYCIPLIVSFLTPLECDVIIFVLLMVIIACLLDTNYRLSPMIGVLGWKVYKITTDKGCTYTLLSKRKLREGNKETLIVQITQCTLLDIGQ